MKTSDYPLSLDNEMKTRTLKVNVTQTSDKGVSLVNGLTTMLTINNATAALYDALRLNNACLETYRCRWWAVFMNWYDGGMRTFPGFGACVFCGAKFPNGSISLVGHISKHHNDLVGAMPSDEDLDRCRIEIGTLEMMESVQG